MNRSFKLFILISVFICIGSVGFWSFQYFLKNNSEDVRCQNCNVILISLDTLRFDKIHNQNTPFLNSLISKSIFFNNAYSNAFFSTPSHMTLFTGTYPLTHKVNGFQSNIVFEQRTLDDQTPLDSAIKTIAEIFSSRHYNTFWSGPNDFLHFSPKLGFYKGFKNIYPSMFNRDGNVEIENKSNQELMTKLGNGRFFLFLHSYINHSPYIPLKEMINAHVDSPNNTILESGSRFFRPFISEDSELNKKIKNCFYPYTSNCFSDVVNYDSYFHSMGRWLEKSLITKYSNADKEKREQYFSEINQLYDQSVKRVDQQLETIMEHLDDRKLLDNTIVVIVSDHGEELFDRGSLSHRNFYQHNIRVPILIYMKNKPMGRIITSKSSLVQVAPTITEMLDLKPLAQFQEKSLFHKSQNIFGYSLGNYYSLDHEYKYMLNWDGEELLFNLEKDPKESNNLILSSPRKIESTLFNFRSGYQKWLNMQQYY